MMFLVKELRFRAAIIKLRTGREVRKRRFSEMPVQKERGVDFRCRARYSDLTVYLNNEIERPPAADVKFIVLGKQSNNAAPPTDTEYRRQVKTLVQN